MGEVKIHFHGSKSFISGIIQWWTLGRFSHVSVEVNGWHYHQIFGKRNFKDRELQDDVRESLTLPMPDVEVAKVYELLEGMIGGEYDNLSTFGFIMNLKREMGNRWFCSEVAERVIGHVYKIPGNTTTLITPTEVYVSLKSYLLGRHYSSSN